MTTLLGLSGALRKASTNSALLRNAATVFAPDHYIAADLRFPLYDGDLEAESGLPDVVQTVASQIAQADAVIIATPEYNKSLSGVLKNALDWISRAEGNPWADKPVAIMSATAGRAGGERAQTALISCLVPFRPRLICGPEVLVAENRNAFDTEGTLTNERYMKALSDLMHRLKAAT
jgi:chromate reductase